MKKFLIIFLLFLSNCAPKLFDKKINFRETVKVEASAQFKNLEADSAEINRAKFLEVRAKDVSDLMKQVEFFFGKGYVKIAESELTIKDIDNPPFISYFLDKKDVQDIANEIGADIVLLLTFDGLELHKHYYQPEGSDFAFLILASQINAESQPPRTFDQILSSKYWYSKPEFRPIRDGGVTYYVFFFKKS